MTNRALVTRRCVAGMEPTVVLDMAALTFMDCSGYSAISEARLELEQHGRTLTIVGAIGEPARLLGMIETA